MSFRMFAKIALVLGLPLTAHAEPSQLSQWFRIGQTTEECSFRASLDLLSGYPFARIVIQDGGQSTVVALAEQEQGGCEYLRYAQVPVPSLPPTFEVTASALCISRLPSYVVTRSLSGVQETCKLAD